MSEQCLHALGSKWSSLFCKGLNLNQSQTVFHFMRCITTNVFLLFLLSTSILSISLSSTRPGKQCKWEPQHCATLTLSLHQTLFRIYACNSYIYELLCGQRIVFYLSGQWYNMLSGHFNRNTYIPAHLCNYPIIQSRGSSTKQKNHE